MPDLSDIIEEAASDPASATVDGQSATARPISDLIQADRYLAEKTALADGTRPVSGWRCLRPARAKPPGAA